MYTLLKGTRQHEDWSGVQCQMVCHAEAFQLPDIYKIWSRPPLEKTHILLC